MKKVFETSEPLNIARGEVLKITHRDPSFDIEDSGQAIILTTAGDGVEGGPGMFVRVQSWDETRQHEELRKFNGRRLRVTVEVIEGET